MILRACHLRGFTRQRSSSTLSYRVRLPRLTITFPSCLFPRCEWTWRDFFLEQTISLKGRGWRGWGHWRGPNWERESSECSWRRHELCCGDQVKEIDRYKICACKKYFYNTLILWLRVVVSLLLIKNDLVWSKILDQALAPKQLSQLTISSLSPSPPSSSTSSSTGSWSSTCQSSWASWGMRRCSSRTRSMISSWWGFLFGTSHIHSRLGCWKLSTFDSSIDWEKS